MGELALRPVVSIEVPTKVEIPASIEEATEVLGLTAKGEALVKNLLNAKDWAKAAIVRAFTAKTGGRLSAGIPALSFSRFADLGINGLSQREAVARYYDAWESTGLPVPQPGETVALPTDPFPKVSDESEWYTPAKYIASARKVLGKIDLDPASDAKANETVKAARILMEEDDSLEQTWGGQVWLNPPWGNAGDFVDHLIAEYENGNVTGAIVLINAHSTDQSWFQPLLDYPVCFTNHRINYENPKGSPSSPRHGSVFAYLGPDEGKFKEEFSQWGKAGQLQ